MTIPVTSVVFSTIEHRNVPEEMLKLDREGISWIRGHHAADSEEVKALLAAAALSHDDKCPRYIRFHDDTPSVLLRGVRVRIDPSRMGASLLDLENLPCTPTETEYFSFEWESP